MCFNPQMLMSICGRTSPGTGRRRQQWTLPMDGSRNGNNGRCPWMAAATATMDAAQLKGSRGQNGFAKWSRVAAVEGARAQRCPGAYVRDSSAFDNTLANYQWAFVPVQLPSAELVKCPFS